MFTSCKMEQFAVLFALLFPFHLGRSYRRDALSSSCNNLFT